MLLDCQKLRHWNWERDIDEIFACRVPLAWWLALLDEQPERIGLFEEAWNHHDTLNDDTKLLHNTEIVTQPWKTGLRADFHAHAPRGPVLYEWIRRRARRMATDGEAELHYQPHPDAHQEQMFFSLLREAVDHGSITTSFLKEAIRKRYLRTDALSILEKSQPRGDDQS